jgi:DNA-binding CsgD family transcriptional regulator
MSIKPRPLDLFTTNNSPVIRDICEPFFKRYNINYFSYGRFYDDGSFDVLLTNANWYDHLWDRKYPIAVPNPEDFVMKQSLFYLWDEGLYAEAVSDAKHYFKMDHGITLVTRRLGYFDYFSFASPVENKRALNFYLNSLCVLETFGSYFLETTEKLVKEVHKHRIILPDRKEKIDIFPSLPSKDISNAQPEFTSTKKTHEIHFTAKELDCLQLLKKGFTAKEIGAHLHLSPRTIHDYLDKIKEKVGVQKKSQIISVLEKTVKSTVG